MYVFQYRGLSALLLLFPFPIGVGTLPAGTCHVEPAIEIHALARAIARAEGFYAPTSLLHKLHNPGGLVFVGQAESSPHGSGFALFHDDNAGWRAAIHDLELKGSLGLSFEQVVLMRCGPADNPLRYAHLLRELLREDQDLEHVADRNGRGSAGTAGAEADPRR